MAENCCFLVHQQTATIQMKKLSFVLKFEWISSASDQHSKLSLMGKSKILSLHILKLKSLHCYLVQNKVDYRNDSILWIYISIVLFDLFNFNKLIETNRNLAEKRQSLAR